MGSKHTCLAVISLYSVLKQRWKLVSTSVLSVFKYIEEKVVQHINDNLSDFSSSHESDEEQL